MTKKIGDGFKRFIYWNKYQTTPPKLRDNGPNIYRLLNASFQGVKRLFILAYIVTDDDNAGIKSNEKCFLPKAKIKNCID